jgi:hypothetical protein
MGAKTGLFHIMFGIMIVVASVFRHVARRRTFGSGYELYMRKNKLHWPVESNEFGQKVLWTIDLDEPDKKGPS